MEAWQRGLKPCYHFNIERAAMGGWSECQHPHLEGVASGGYMPLASRDKYTLFCGQLVVLVDLILVTFEQM